MNNNESLKFNFDVSAFRLIGRELITDKITAVFELVKNSYDANAENVEIEFQNIQNVGSAESKIIIRDDGKGMSFSDVKNKWMVIGTDNKRTVFISDDPYNRRLVGKKGIGRFAVDKLGNSLILKTKQSKDSELFCLENDWSKYEKLELEQITLFQSGTEKTAEHNPSVKTENEEDLESKKFFTDVENIYWYEQPVFDKGTELIISKIRDPWTEEDISRLYKVLSTLIVPEKKLKYPFNLKIIAPETNNYKNKVVESFALEEIATTAIKLGFDSKKQLQDVLTIDKEGNLSISKKNKRIFGLINLHLYYYDINAKQKFHKIYPEEQLTGIKIYRDGILTTPFVDSQEEIDYQKDLFGIDKRRWSGFFDKISSRDLLGWIDITEADNPDIIEATNRQGFVENEAWLELQKFIIEVISVLEKQRKNLKDKNKKQEEKSFKDSKDSIANLRAIIANTNTDDENVKQNLNVLSSELSKLQGALTKTHRSLIETKKEKERQEELMFSLVSLQTYAGMLSHIVRTLLGRIKRSAEFIRDMIDNVDYRNNCKSYATRIFTEMENLDKSVDFLLRYSKDGNDFEPINLKDFFLYLFEVIYKDEFEKEQIELSCFVDDTVSIKYNRKALNDIFDNLISNTMKAFAGKPDNRKIKIRVQNDKNELKIFYSNNGPLISEADKERIFDIFFTTTAAKGGAGLGLYIVKTRLEAVQGKIELIDSEFAPEGVTFLLSIPYSRGKK
ncbi:MAG: sensor histidine kinase [Spirochaetaceae bacterium]|nr:sensor histidine kinase [Spirochaetaceae bacterium]